MEKPEISNYEEAKLAGYAIKFQHSGGTRYNKKYLLSVANDPYEKEEYRKAANSLLQKIRNIEKISKENEKKNGVHKPEQNKSKNNNINL